MVLSYQEFEWRNIEQDFQLEINTEAEKSCGFSIQWRPYAKKTVGEERQRKLVGRGDNRIGVQRGRRDTEKKETRGSKVGQRVCI